MYNHQLDTFIQVADAGSFSKAAEALFISSTAVMKQINLLRCCDAMELMRVPICCAVSIYHLLAQKKMLSIEDMSGQRLMLIKRNWSKYVNRLRDELWAEHPDIQIVDFPFYNLEVFNQCEHENALLMAVPQWEGVHPLLKILPVDWDHSIPFGLLHSPAPSSTVQKLMDAIAIVLHTEVQPKG